MPDTPSEAESRMVVLRDEAEGGSAEAMRELGLLLSLGDAADDTSEPNWEAAAMWWAKAADLGDSASMLNLGSLYAKGTLGRKDFDKALSYFERAHEAGEVTAMEQIKKIPLASSSSWWLARSKSGDVAADLFLAASYETGAGVPKDLDVAARYYGLAADKGDEAALAKMMELPTIYTKAWWERRADEGSAVDKRALADSFAKGTGSAPDWESAARCYGEAADAGDALALAQMRTLPLQYTAEWWEKKALAGDAEAAFFVAEGYATGRGTRVDANQANRFYAIAAEEGHPDAAGKLKQMPLADTADWWDEQAVKGDLEASLYLVKAYGGGHMGPIKVMMASKYAMLAATQGSMDCLYAIMGVIALFVLLLAIPKTRGIAFGLMVVAAIWFALLIVS